MRYQHLAFHQLNTGEDFFYRKYRYCKTSFWTGRMILDGDLVIIMPWTKVRSTRPFGKPTVSHSVRVCAASVERPPVAVTPGGDRTPETIGGNEKCPSA